MHFQEFSIGFDEMTSLQKKLRNSSHRLYTTSNINKAANFLAGVNLKHTTGVDLYAGRSLPHIECSCFEKTFGGYDYHGCIIIIQ